MPGYTDAGVSYMALPPFGRPIWTDVANISHFCCVFGVVGCRSVWGHSAIGV